MVHLLYPDFLHNEVSFRKSVQIWNDFWMRQDDIAIRLHGWTTPWFPPSPALEDGNPIFSAVSHQLRRGIRVIQHEATESEPEFSIWFDNFGETAAPDAIEELVVACALSDETLRMAEEHIAPWIRGLPATNLP